VGTSRQDGGRWQFAQGWRRGRRAGVVDRSPMVRVGRAWEVGGIMILCQLSIVGARRPMEGVVTEGRVRQCTQARAGVGLVPTRKKKDQAVPNHTTLIP
jgi:hypothetical protein